jgi:SAM-dependent methyltransferase
MNVKQTIEKLCVVLTTRPLTFLRVEVNKLGKKHKCNICGQTFHAFYPYKTDSPSASSFLKELNMIGRGVDDYGCFYCNSSDRERHLFMFFDKLNLWQEFTQANVLHFAPERNLSPSIKRMKPAQYVMGDLYPSSDEIRRIDVTDIQFPDDSFDFVICNHVLEHVLDDRRAMREIFRVLREGGKAILQTPYSNILGKSFEDANINSDEMKIRFYGESSHVRVYGLDLFERLEESGFRLNVVKNDELYSRNECGYYGVDHEEDLILVLKSGKGYHES